MSAALLLLVPVRRRSRCRLPRLGLATARPQTPQLVATPPSARHGVPVPPGTPSPRATDAVGPATPRGLPLRPARPPRRPPRAPPAARPARRRPPRHGPAADRAPPRRPRGAQRRVRRRLPAPRAPDGLALPGPPAPSVDEPRASPSHPQRPRTQRARQEPGSFGRRFGSEACTATVGGCARRASSSAGPADLPKRHYSSPPLVASSTIGNLPKHTQRAAPIWSGRLFAGLFVDFRKG